MAVTNTYWTAPKRNAQPPAKPQPRPSLMGTELPRLSASDGLLQATLDARVLEPRRRPNVSGRHDEFGQDVQGMGGTPRRASKKHAFNKRRVYGAKSKFDSSYAGTGQASEKGEFAKRLAAIDATLGTPVIPLK